MWTIKLPTYVWVGSKQDKKFYLNLNIYRNAHYHTLNQAKVAFTELVKPKLKNLPPQEHIRLTYTLYPQSRRGIDVANVCCIVDKFFSDTLVAAKTLEDDNHTVVVSVHFRFGEVRKNDPHVEVLIEAVSPDGEIVIKNSTPKRAKADKVQVAINEAEIKQAITDYIGKMVNIPQGMSIKDIDLKATRGEEGYQAFIDIEPLTGKAPEAVQALHADLTVGSDIATSAEPAERKTPPANNIFEKPAASTLAEPAAETATQAVAASAPVQEAAEVQAPLHENVAQTRSELAQAVAPEATAETAAETEVDEVRATEAYADDNAVEAAPVASEPVAEAAVPAQAEDTAQNATAAAKPSLFSNLAKPVNTPEA